MSDETDKPKDRDDQKSRALRNELRGVLQTRFKAVPTDDHFREMLERLDQAEPKE
jgi:hypothetical protein